MTRPEISGQISWVYTGDLDETCTFYGDVLGFDLVRSTTSAKIYRTAETSYIGVCQVFEDRIIEPAGGMITLLTDDVDKWYARLKDKGAQLRGPPHRLDAFGIYTFFAEDPNGYVIEFQQFLDQAESD